MDDLVIHARDCAVIVAPVGRASGAGRWNAAECLRDCADRIEALEAQLARIREPDEAMVERVARALSCANSDDDTPWRMFAEDARAALAAMVPTAPE